MPMLATEVAPAAAPPDCPAQAPLADRLAEGALNGPLAAVLALLCIAQVAAWLPHYLTWPLWCDTDVFMKMAHGWDAGRVPYRDYLWHNFPGPLYQYWLLGKLTGWGNTVAVQAADAAFLLAMEGLLLAWSRRRFGRLLPGLCGAAAVLTVYLNQDYSRVGQRDWYAAGLTVAGLLIVEAWPGRAGRWLSAFAVAAGVAYRPQVVLFLPTVAVALDEVARPPGGHWTRTAAAWVGWGVAFAVALVLVFSPLIWAGILDDMLRGVRSVVGGTAFYRHTPTAFLRKLVTEVKPLGVGAILASAILFAGRGPAATRRLVLTWALAMACGLLYRPLTPANHEYLRLPEQLVRSVVLAAVVGLVLNTRDLVPSVRLAVVLLLLGMEVEVRPKFCRGGSDVRAAVSALRRGEDPESAPPGFLPYLAFYAWEDYRATLAHLRRTTSPRTEVANALQKFLSINGPTGRLSPYPNDSTLAWVWVVRPDDINVIAQDLERTPDSVVVWAPSEPQDRVTLGPLEEVIRRLYEPDARFGLIEIWRRKLAADAETGPMPPAGRPALGPGQGVGR